MPVCPSINWIIMVSGNGLLPVQRQATIWINEDINWTTKNKLHWNLKRIMKIFIEEYALENVGCMIYIIYEKEIISLILTV